MLKNKFLLLTSVFLLASCSSLPDWLGSGDETPRLTGERYSVMEGETGIAPDPSMEEETIDIPEETSTPSNASYSRNYRLEGDLNSVKTIDAGDEPDSEFFLNYPPVVEDNTVYVIDGRSNIAAFDAESLKQKWEKDTEAPKKDRNLPGGGIGFAYGVLYASTGFGEVIALSAADGSQVWKKTLDAPLRRPPAVGDDKVFAVTIDNQLFALSAADGSTLWRHSGVKENTSFYGSANPAVKNDVVVVAYSSGEIFGISTIRGNELWTEVVSPTSSNKSAASALSDVTASPVIVDGIVYIGGNSGDLVAYNAANGFKIWQQKLGSVDTTPWVAGRYIYVVAKGNKIVALNRFDGRIKWVGDLPKPKDKDVKNFWSGPVMAGGKLIIVGSDGQLLQVDALTGQLIKNIKVPAGIYNAPVVANGKLYMLTRKAELVQVK